MNDDIYRALAQRLDATPNGFPATESGVELRLLARLFDPSEAKLARVMRMSGEPAADIAARVGLETRQVQQTLKGMARKGLIWAGRGDGQMIFGLLPFVVGFYEAQLGQMDADLAALVEQYFQDSRMSLLQTEPALHRVIPVEQAIPFDLQVFPYEQAAALIENARAWGVRDCVCRVQRRLVGQGCDAPVHNCVSFAPVEGAFDQHPVTQAISKQEALRIVHEAEQAGLVHTTGNYRDGHSYICNCCTCCCGILRGVAEFDMPTAVARSDFYAVVDRDTCIACGNCLERCSFYALSVDDAGCAVDIHRCVGCGLCAMACPVGALSLTRRAEGEHPFLPTNEGEWQQARADERGLALADIL